MGNRHMKRAPFGDRRKSIIDDNLTSSSTTTSSVCRANKSFGSRTSTSIEEENAITCSSSYYSSSSTSTSSGSTAIFLEGGTTILSYSSSPSILYHLLSCQEALEEVLLILNHKNIPPQLRTKLLFYKGWDGVGYSNSLHKTLSHFSHLEKGKEVVMRMIDIGGWKLVMEKGNDGVSVLHSAICGQQRADLDIVREIIRFGGKELLLQQDAFGNNILHSLCSHTSGEINHAESADIMHYILDVADKDLIMQQNKEGNTSMHLVCMKLSFELIECFLDSGGNDTIGMLNKYGDLPIHLLVRRLHEKSDLTLLTLLLDEGISSGIGGEYAIGGLMLLEDCSLECDRITILEMLMKKLKSRREDLFFAIDDIAYGLPIIQAAIEARVTDIEVLRNIITHFDWSIITRNKLGQLPIHIGAANGLSWKKGGMELIVDASKGSVYEIDPMTGLLPYALAAAGNSDLETVYRLIQHSVHLL